MGISDYTTTTKLAVEMGYPVWAIRRAVDALNLAERFDGRVRAVPRSAIPSVKQWIEARKISPVGDVK